MIEITADGNEYEKKCRNNEFIVCGANKVALAFLYLVRKTDIVVNCILESVHPNRKFLGNNIEVPIMSVKQFWEIEQNSIGGGDKKYQIIIFSDHFDKYIEEIRKVFGDTASILILIPNDNINFNKMFSIFRRRLLKEENISIISNNCAAGLIYSALGIRFQSPTINTLIYPEDFIKFCSRLEYYLEQKIELSGFSHRGTTKENYPVGRLNDILIHFVHATDWEKCRKEWDERKTRINAEQLYFIFNDAQYFIPHNRAKEFLSVPRGKKLIVQRRCAYFLNHTIYSPYDFCNKALYEEWIDLVSWLNGEETYSI